ncbi:cystatin-like [Pleurodeles waltl]|uniref:cystatin-like n=1 Tax=Pleurodeles waltl TaxID=8319 RepID=UPI003709770D
MGLQRREPTREMPGRIKGPLLPYCSVDDKAKQLLCCTLSAISSNAPGIAWSTSLKVRCGTNSDKTLVGAPENIDPYIPAVQNAATFAMNAYNEQSKDEYVSKVLHVVSAKAQVVAGVIYTMEVKVGRTQCKKGSTVNADSCALMLTPGLRQTFLCNFEVLEVPWQNEEKLLQSSCKPLLM